jgi:serine/threonine protein kinase
MLHQNFYRKHKAPPILLATLRFFHISFFSFFHFSLFFSSFFAAERWALGVILYELIALRHPFEPAPSDTDADLMANIRTCNFLPLPSDCSQDPQLQMLVSELLIVV